MARVVVTDGAAGELRELIKSHSLPPGTVERVKRALRPLEDFPEIGPELGGSMAGRRFILGPWRWLIAVYRYDPDRDLVAVLAFVDARTSESPTANR